MQLGAVAQQGSACADVNIVGQRQQPQPVFGLRRFAQRLVQALGKVSSAEGAIRARYCGADRRCVLQQLAFKYSRSPEN